MMRILSSRLILVPSAVRASSWPSLADPDDEPVHASAVAFNADYVVSRNTRDFPPNVAGSGAPDRHVWDGIEYVEPGAFLERIGWSGVSDV
jgi:hypothetical protein